MIKEIFFKELLEMIRDKKYLFVTIIFPILFTPVLILGLGYLQADAEIKKQASTHEYAWLEGQIYPELEALLAEDSKFKRHPELSLAEAEKALQQGQLKIYLAASNTGNSINLAVGHKSSGFSSPALKHIKRQIAELETQLVNAKLVSLGIEEDKTEQFLSPIELKERDYASDKESLGEILGGMLPFLIIVWVLATATAISSDLVAGEKERGTLETLLISPVNYFQIVIGKWLTICLFSWVSGALTFIGLWLCANLFAHLSAEDDIIALIQVISPLDISLATLSLIPVAGLVSAVLLVTASVANSFKESQTYASGVMFLLFIPLLANMGGGLDLTLKTALIPMVSNSLIFTEVLKGTFNYWYLVPTTLMNCVVIFFILTIAVAMYRSEKVLQRS